ncbi:MAG TPA: nucleoside diphosphate kinase regulator [Steroidobacteraceae bacterium]
MSTKAQLAQSARPRITVAASEHALLTGIAERAVERDLPVGEFLAEELSRANVVPDEDCATNVVRLGSTITYREDSTGRVRTVTLVLPKDANIDQQRISVLTPIGAALLGLTPGQSIEWPAPGGEMEMLTVIDVKSPESH